MAKRPPRGKCVHCLEDNVDRTWDHIFPRAWYPETTPVGLYKWQIPSCQACNRDYGRMEEDLLLRLALCIEPDAPEAAGILEKVFRSIDPESAKNERDRAARAARKVQLHSALRNASEIPQSAVYPGLGERWGRPPTEGIGITVPAHSLRRLAEKIVRGIYFLENKTFIEAGHSVEFYVLNEEGAGPIKELLGRFGQEYARGSGIIVRRAIAEDQPMAAVFEIVVWGKLKMYASVWPPGL